MPDPIRSIHLLFEDHFGKDMRMWPGGAKELKAAVTNHTSKVIRWYREEGKKEGKDEAIKLIKEALSGQSNNAGSL